MASTTMRKPLHVNLKKQFTVTKGTSMTLTVPNNRVYLLISYQGNSTAFRGAWIVWGGSTNSTVTPLKDAPNNVSITTGSGTITIANASSSYDTIVCCTNLLYSDSTGIDVAT